jgi:hypothetical protein
LDGSRGKAEKRAIDFVFHFFFFLPTAIQVIEQENGYDFKADIWSMGITVCCIFCWLDRGNRSHELVQASELANGKTPFDGQKPLKVLKSILRPEPPQLTGEFSAVFKVSIPSPGLGLATKYPHTHGAGVAGIGEAVPGAGSDEAAVGGAIAADRLARQRVAAGWLDAGRDCNRGPVGDSPIPAEQLNTFIQVPQSFPCQVVGQQSRKRFA